MSLPVNQTLEISNLTHLIANLLHLAPLTASSVQKSQLIERKKFCLQELAKHLDEPNTKLVDIFQSTHEHLSTTNRTSLLYNLCDLEVRQAYSTYYYEQWANSMERFIAKTVLDGGLFPVLQAIDLITLVFFTCPIYTILSKKMRNAGFWYLLHVHSLTSLAHFICFHLPKLTYTIIKIWGVSAHLMRYARPENLGLISCSVFMFTKHLLSFLPMWMVSLALWDQVAKHYKLSRNNSRESFRVCRSDTEMNYHNALRVYSTSSTSSHQPMQRHSESARGSSTALLHTTLMNDGLTRFGAKLLSMTITVLHVFCNVHYFWLYSVVEGKCKVDSDKHSYIFPTLYSYLLWVLLRCLPQCICVIGLCYSIWITRLQGLPSEPIDATVRIKSLDSKDHQTKNVVRETATFDIPKGDGHQYHQHKTLCVQQYKSFILQVQSTGLKRSANFHKSMNEGLHKRSTAYVSCVELLKQRNRNGLHSLNEPPFVIVNHSDLTLILAVTVCILLCNIPQDAVWLYTNQTNSTLKKSFGGNYHELKTRHLLENAVKCWSLLSNTISFVLAIIVSRTVRLQFKNLYLNRSNYDVTNCNWGCCGFYCNVRNTVNK